MVPESRWEKFPASVFEVGLELDDAFIYFPHALCAAVSLMLTLDSIQTYVVNKQSTLSDMQAMSVFHCLSMYQSISSLYLQNLYISNAMGRYGSMIPEVITLKNVYLRSYLYIYVCTHVP